MNTSNKITFSKQNYMSLGSYLISSKEGGIPSQASAILKRPQR